MGIVPAQITVMWHYSESRSSVMSLLIVRLISCVLLRSLIFFFFVSTEPRQISVFAHQLYCRTKSADTLFRYRAWGALQYCMRGLTMLNLQTVLNLSFACNKIKHVKVQQLRRRILDTKDAVIYSVSDWTLFLWSPYPKVLSEQMFNQQIGLTVLAWIRMREWNKYSKK